MQQLKHTIFQNLLNEPRKSVVQSYLQKYTDVHGSTRSKTKQKYKNKNQHSEKIDHQSYHRTIM